nr:GIY-YIG nuclease family protein [Robertkochia sp. 3YJGBD-33]
MLHNYFLYILTNKNKTVLYIGVTNNIQRRIGQHYDDSVGLKRTFAGKYNCYYLVYYECFDIPDHAIRREKELKGWSRKKKMNLITSFNPKWLFLNNDVF